MGNSLKPQLRFPNFIEEWETKTLEEIASFSKGKGISKADIDDNGTLECIRYGELYTEYGEIINQIKSKTNLDPNDLVLSEKNDVIIPASGETKIDIATASCVLKDGVALGGDLNIIKSSLDGVFLSYYLNYARKKDIANVAQGISVVHLYSSQLKKIEVNIPKIEEQQKITSFLTAIERHLQLLKKKNKALEKYKKGVMKKIFEREMRFKDENGNEFSAWKYDFLFKLADIVKGQQLNKEFLTASGSYPAQNGGIEPSGYTEDYNTDENTITISEGGNSCGYVNFMKVKFWCGGHCYSLLNLKEFILQDYLYQYLKFNQDSLMSLRVGSGLPNIQKNDLSKFTVIIPTVNEQAKISSFLTDIDTQINLLEIQIDKLKIFKKGLMQQMFV
ncbi:putative type I restriction enzyme specificity protein MPN_638 [compost metagenome]